MQAMNLPPPGSGWGRAESRPINHDAHKHISFHVKDVFHVQGCKFYYYSDSISAKTQMNVGGYLVPYHSYHDKVLKI